MPATTRTLNDIRQTGMAALARALGPTDAIRFLQQFSTGHGDYTRERQSILQGIAMDDLLAELGRMQRPARHRSRRPASRRS